MHQELTTEQLRELLEQFLAIRCEGTDPTQLNLRFCPALESCDGPSRSVLFRFHTYSWMSNPMGVTHGGIVTAILDASMGTLCTSFYQKRTPTITMTTNYCRPVPLDADVLVNVRATHTGGTSAQFSAEMYLPGEPGLPLATATGVYYTAHTKK